MNNEAVNYEEKYNALFIEHLNLKHELDQLKRLIYGSRHERFIPSIAEEQLVLGLQTASIPTQQNTSVTETIAYTRTKKTETSEKIQSGRMKLPADLPRERVLIEPSQDVSGMKKIGEEITE